MAILFTWRGIRRAAHRDGPGEQNTSYQTLAASARACSVSRSKSDLPMGLPQPTGRSELTDPASAHGLTRLGGCRISSSGFSFLVERGPDDGTYDGFDDAE